MQINKDDTTIPFRIRSYEPGKIVINEQVLTQSVLISNKQLQTDWRPQQFSDLETRDFDRLADFNRKLIIFGTGPSQHFPHPSLYALLLAQGFMIEFMHSKAACHTFNILMSENRDALCALLL